MTGIRNDPSDKAEESLLPANGADSGKDNENRLPASHDNCDKDVESLLPTNGADSDQDHESRLPTNDGNCDKDEESLLPAQGDEGDEGLLPANDGVCDIDDESLLPVKAYASLPEHGDKAAKGKQNPLSLKAKESHEEGVSQLPNKYDEADEGEESQLLMKAKESHEGEESILPAKADEGDEGEESPLPVKALESHEGEESLLPAKGHEDKLHVDRLLHANADSATCRPQLKCSALEGDDSCSSADGDGVRQCVHAFEGCLEMMAASTAGNAASSDVAPRPLVTVSLMDVLDFGKASPAVDASGDRAHPDNDQASPAHVRPMPVEPAVSTDESGLLEPVASGLPEPPAAPSMDLLGASKFVVVPEAGDSSNQVTTELPLLCMTRETL